MTTDLAGLFRTLLTEKLYHVTFEQARRAAANAGVKSQAVVAWTLDMLVKAGDFAEWQALQARPFEP